MPREHHLDSGEPLATRDCRDCMGGRCKRAEDHHNRVARRRDSVLGAPMSSRADPLSPKMLANAYQVLARARGTGHSQPRLTRSHPGAPGHIPGERDYIPGIGDSIPRLRVRHHRPPVRLSARPPNCPLLRTHVQKSGHMPAVGQSVAPVRPSDRPTVRPPLVDSGNPRSTST
jgi:hypothetical protein